MYQCKVCCNPSGKIAKEKKGDRRKEQVKRWRMSKRKNLKTTSESAAGSLTTSDPGSSAGYSDPGSSS